MRVRLAAAAAAARSDLNGVRQAAGDRLAEVDLALGTPGVRRLRRLELALLEPAARPAAVAGDLGVWRAGLAARTAALRRLERTVAGGLGASSGAWLGRQERRLRDQLVLAGGVALVTLAAAGLLGRGLGGRDRRAGRAAGRRGGGGAGSVAVDLIHLLAELLDNAAAYSSPAAPISVSASADGDGYLVEVGDRGLGMTDQELAWANRRLAGRAAALPARRSAHSASPITS